MICVSFDLMSVFSCQSLSSTYLFEFDKNTDKKFKLKVNMDKLVVKVGILLVFLVIILLSSCLAEDEIITDLDSEISESGNENSHNHRTRREIPFLSSWFYPKEMKGKDGSSAFTSEGNDLTNHTESTDVDRQGRFLSLFTVVRYENTECLSSSGDNGTCYPNAECYRRGGAASGKCAEGYGVCCVFTKTCGASTRQNCTYFTHNPSPSSAVGTGSCQLSVYKCSPDVCQFKLDFVSFNIAQPGTNGICTDDQFIISGTSTAIPVICGSNTGNHMYVDATPDNSPITLSVITSGSHGNSRSWKIKVTQIRCNTLARAPDGCLNYHQGVSGTIRSYNFDFNSGRQLSNQDYSICIRSERNFCGIRYTGCGDSGLSTGGQNPRPRAFSLTGGGATASGAEVGETNCQRDWIHISCATNSGRIRQERGDICQDRICGDVFNSEKSNNPAAVYSYAKPFIITYHTDSNETSDTDNRGFCLNYIQQPCASMQYISSLQ